MNLTKPAQAMELRRLSPVFGVPRGGRPESGMRKLGQVVLASIALYAGVVGVGWLWARMDPGCRPCPPTGTLVQVDTGARVLCLCRQGRVEGRFRTALGRGGVSKRTEGDEKTPLGRYSLAPAISSSRFHLFIPVGYPTADQRARGYSGGAIGIHGPHLAFLWLGHATTWANWTQGCIAVGTRGQVEQIAGWVRESGAAEIVLI
jgi:hypothetical protein